MDMKYEPIQVDLLKVMDMLEETHNNARSRWKALRELIELQKEATARALAASAAGRAGEER